MFQHALNPTTQKLTAGVIAAAIFAWPAVGADNSAIPNFSRTAARHGLPAYPMA